MSGRLFHYKERQTIAAEIAKALLRDQELTFFARELGYSDHTAIHEAIKPILAKHVAKMATDLMGEAELQHWLDRAALSSHGEEKKGGGE